LRRRAGLVATLTVGALVLAACGGDATPRAVPTSPSPTSTATQTGSPTPGQSTPPSSGATVEIIDNEYRPAEVTVATGSTVIWRHAGTAAHSVTAKDGSFDSHPQCNTSVGLSQCMQPGQTFPRLFNAPGRFEYICHIHGTLMTGVVVVT
jgi:plastocyanin